LILLFTNQRDLTTDFVVLELQRRSAAFRRINTENLPLGFATVGFRGREDWTLQLGDDCIRGEDVQAAYFRRPGPPELSANIREAGERAYCHGEWGALLKTIYSRLDTRWLNSPAAIMLAEDKPRQLLLALELGFRVPETVVTNAIDAACSFLEGPAAIAKPLREALIPGVEEKVIFTSRVGHLSGRDAQAFAAAPMILQREIPKRVDLRVTVVGDRVFATAIGSQQHEETQVDWRRGGVAELSHDVFDLPADVSERCRRLVKELGLRFGAIDLVWDQDGEFWFLEINPNGQWAWIENRTGQPIVGAIVDELERISAQ